MLEDIKNSKHIVGIKQSTRAVEGSIVLEAYVAKDANTGMVAPFEKICLLNAVPITYIESKKQLGEACGIEVGAAVAVVLK